MLEISNFIHIGITKTALWGAPYGAFFLAIFTEEEWFLIEKGLLEYFQQPLYRTF